MITRIEVDGFKTLSQFALEFQPGLNILVGPNGAGKTNIVSFFEFLNHLAESEASEAVSRAGGAGAIFRRVGFDNYQRQISARVVGCLGIVKMSHKSREQETIYVVYDYSFDLVLPESRDAVLFSRQSVKTSQVSDFYLPSAAELQTMDWSTVVDVEVGEDGLPRAIIRKSNFEIMELPILAGKSAQKENVQQLEKFLTGMLNANISLIGALSRVSAGYSQLQQDISGGHVYNIIPSRIKIPEDSAKPPGISRDGSGLAATLYAIQRNKDTLDLDAWSFFPGRRRSTVFAATSLEQLRNFLAVVNPSIERLDVINDPFDNQLRVRFQVHSGSYSASVPLALMSDGTLKWVALVTAALTSHSVFSIEEPENYLHPHMQAQIVNILREILFRSDSRKMTIMTTHSETLLNQCKPNELVIVSLVDGRTVALTCSAPEQVNAEIRRTGFGLGYYYVSDAL